MKMRTNASEMFKTKADSMRVLQDPIAITPHPLYAENEHQAEDEQRRIKTISNDKYNRRNSFVETSTFNPDVLNKFLEDYASKIKTTTERDLKYPFRIVKPPPEPLVLEVDDESTRNTITQGEKFDQTANGTSVEDAVRNTCFG